MKVIFEKSILLNAIQPALSCVSGKNTIPAIEGINLDCSEEGKCIVTSYDLEKGFRTEIPCDTQKTGNYILNASKLTQIVRAMPSGYLTLEVDANNVTRIYSGKSEFEIYAMNGADFPQLPVLTGDIGFHIQKGVLKNMITKTQFAVAQNDMRPELNGAFFKIEGSKITVVSCDGSKMAIKEQITDISNQIKALRKEIDCLEKVEQRSAQVAENIKDITADRAEFNGRNTKTRDERRYR